MMMSNDAVLSVLLWAACSAGMYCAWFAIGFRWHVVSGKKFLDEKFGPEPDNEQIAEESTRWQIVISASIAAVAWAGVMAAIPHVR